MCPHVSPEPALLWIPLSSQHVVLGAQVVTPELWAGHCGRKAPLYCLSRLSVPLFPCTGYQEGSRAFPRTGLPCETVTV